MAANLKPNYIKIGFWTAGGITAFVLGRKLFGRKTKLPTRNKRYKDPTLMRATGGVTQWSPTPLAKQLYSAMDGYNATGREEVWKLLYGIVDPLKVKAVYYEYNSIANMNNDKMTLTQRIRDEFAPVSFTKDDLLIKLDTLQLS